LNLDIACLPQLRPQTYQPHALHATERAWPETNCYVDLWIEVLHAMNLPPQASFAFTVTQDFEGDQIGFFKIPTEDLEMLYGIRVQELAIFDNVEDHLLTQIARGRLCIVEMDSFFLPDTRGLTYHIEHGKTTLGINRLNPATRTLEYFHNGGYYALSGDDFDGLFRRGAHAGLDELFLPYTEFAKLDGLVRRQDLREASVELLRRHLQRRPKANPIAAFAKAFPEQARAILDKKDGFFHKYAFNTLRQIGANFGLLADYLIWRELEGEADLVEPAAAAQKIADTAKVAQFQLARALARQRFEPLGAMLDPAVEAWDKVMAILDQRYR